MTIADIEKYIEEGLYSHTNNIFDNGDRMVHITDVKQLVIKLISEKYDEYILTELFKVKVEWQDGSITNESVIKEDDLYYYFNFDEHNSSYAPKYFCTKI